MRNETSDEETGLGPIVFLRRAIKFLYIAFWDMPFSRRGCNSMDSRHESHELMLTMRLVATVITTQLAGCSSAEDVAIQAARERGKAAQALFEEKCRTIAGARIHRKVEGVEGILLMKVRPRSGPKEWADPMWPGAAFAREFDGDEYITSFLAYEHSSSPTKEPVTPTQRGYIGTDFLPDNPSNLPGYRFVDVIDESVGKRYRYSGKWTEPWAADRSYLKGYVKFYLEKVPAIGSQPRYAVTYEDHVISEERALGIASSTIKVVDTQGGEVLGEFTRYAWGAVRPNAGNPSPWLTARRCPDVPVGADAVTRKFVDQVLIPKGRP